MIKSEWRNEWAQRSSIQWKEERSQNRALRYTVATVMRLWKFTRTFHAEWPVRKIRSKSTRHQIKQIATAWTSVVPRKKMNLLNDKRIKSCLSRFDSGAYSRRQFLRAVSHSVGAHTESLHPRVDNSSSSNSSEDEDEDRQAPVPASTTSGASESATAAAATTSDDCCKVCKTTQWWQRKIVEIDQSINQSINQSITQSITIL